MRPKQLDIDPANANLTGFASNVTGASFTLTTTTTTDGLAHQVSIRNDSATDHSGKTVVLVGTDADGRPQSETVTAPGTSATVESTKYFKTLTSATPSATIGADTFDIGWVDEVATQTIPLEWRANTPAMIHVVVTGTISYTIQGTLQDIRDDGAAPFTFTDQEDLAWFSDANFTAKTATLADDLAIAGYRAIRLIINSYTDTAELQVFMTFPDNK